MRRALWLMAIACWSIVTDSFADNYSDIWWNPLESGWGVTIADHETNLFAVLFVYLPNRHPVWFAVSGGTFSQNRRIFQGDIYLTAGPAYTSGVFNPAQVTAQKVGSATIDFSPPGLAAGTALLTYSISGSTFTKQVQRQPFGNAAPNWGFDKTDIWWNPDESGWGLALAQHGNNVFGVWYTYDVDNTPLWIAMSGGTFTSASTFTGALYRTTGPFFGDARFDPSTVSATQVGSATIAFGGTNAFDSLAGKALTQCPGLSADFAATIGAAGYRRLTCPQPFGLSRPSSPTPPQPAAVTCTGTYTATFVFPLCPAIGRNTFPGGGTFTTHQVNYNQSGPFAGTVDITGVPNVVLGDGGCQIDAINPSLGAAGIAFAGSMDLSRIGQADLVFPYGDFLVPIHAQFSVGTSTVLGTLTGAALTGLNNRFSCTY